MKRAHTLGLVLLSTLLLSHEPAHAQRLVAEPHGHADFDLFGSAVVSVGDLDKDGKDDLAVGAPQGIFGGAGFVEVLGASGTLLRFEGQSPFDEFGFALDCREDFDGDGIRDLWVGAPNGAGGLGEVFLYSLATGDKLLHVVGPQSGSRFGDAIVAFPDVDLDSVPDFAVGAPGEDVSSSNDGAVHVFSGATGTEFYEFSDFALGLFQGSAIDAGYLFDQRGSREVCLAVGCIGANNFSGAIVVLRAADGSVLNMLQGSANDGLGQSVCVVPDLDGDRLDELLVGATGAGPGDVGHALLLDHDLTLLAEFLGDVPDAGLGEAVDAGDVDGDGIPELLVSSTRAVEEMRVYSGVPPHHRLCTVGDEDAQSGGTAIASLGDFDGDRFPDFAYCDPSAQSAGLTLGRVRIYGGKELLLDILPERAAVGDLVTLQARLTDPGAHGYLVLSSLNGSPMFQKVLSTAFDGEGKLDVSSAMPPGLVGTKLGFLVLALDPNGDLHLTNEEFLTGK